MPAQKPRSATTRQTAPETEPKAMPTAAAITDSVNNSRAGRSSPLCHNSQGNNLRPTSSISAKPAHLQQCPPQSAPELRGNPVGPEPPLPAIPSGGSSTSTSTRWPGPSTTSHAHGNAARSSRSSTPRASRASSSTTVLAHESDSPNINPPAQPQPIHHASPMPSRVATLICTTAPGTAMRRTESRSPVEKCSPRQTSAASRQFRTTAEAMCTSATKPGVAGPIRMLSQQVAHQSWPGAAFGDEAKHQRPAKSGQRWWWIKVRLQSMPGGRCGQPRKRSRRESGRDGLSGQARHNVFAVSDKRLLFQPVLPAGLYRVASRCVRAMLWCTTAMPHEHAIQPDWRQHHHAHLRSRPDLQRFARAQPCWTTSGWVGMNH